MLLRWSLIKSLFGQRDQILPTAFHQGPLPILQRWLKRMDGRKGGMKCPRIVLLRHCVFCISIIEVPLDFSSPQWAGGPIPGAAKATWLPSPVWRAVILTDGGFDEAPTPPKHTTQACNQPLSLFLFFNHNKITVKVQRRIQNHVSDNSKSVGAGCSACLRWPGADVFGLRTAINLFQSAF